MSVPYETDDYETFELVTKGLESLDLYQESENKNDLEQADRFLGEALEKESDYFRAQYFRAMTNYFGGQEAQAIDWFTQTLTHQNEKKEPKDPFVSELRYNFAAALYEVCKKNRQFDPAIREFKKLIDEIPTDDLVLSLLARAGTALAYAQRARQRGSHWDLDFKSARIYANYVERELLRDADPLWRLSWRRRIDKQVEQELRRIVVETRELLKEAGRTPTKGNQSGTEDDPESDGLAVA